ncbi:MAG: hypothetical protein IPM12_14020 [Flavobacteriales bacterium]|nr:hypothetical protein [Flavobacteriales bacterium]
MNQQEHLDELARIRGLMDRSTRFLSLSGLSGVIAGVAALFGAFAAREHHLALVWSRDYTGYSGETIVLGPMSRQDAWWDHVTFLLADGALVLAVALLGAFWFTWRRSKRTGQGLWDASARRMVANLFLPLVGGGLFSLALILNGAVQLVPAATLLFYGIALLNASKYTLDEIRWLGLSDMALGAVAAFWADAGLLFWALGFGVLHIFYGGLMWLRHERGGEKA